MSTSVLRGGYIELFHLSGFCLSVLLGGLLYFFLTLFLLNRYSNKVSVTKFMLLSIAGTLILELPVWIIAFDRTLISLPDTIFKTFAIICACSVFKSKIIGKSIGTFMVLGACVWMAYCGYDLWLNKLNYKTFTGNITQKLETPVVFQNNEDSNITLSELGAEYVILDFWVSSCGVCFREFPQVQELYEELKDRPDIKLYSVFCRDSKRGETLEWGANRLAELGYAFPTVSIDISEPLLREVEINRFPAVLIIDNRNTVLFKGSINLAKKYLRKLNKGDK